MGRKYKTDEPIGMSTKELNAMFGIEDTSMNDYTILCQYSAQGDNTWGATTNTIKTLPAGAYKIGRDRNGGILFELTKLNVDELLYFPDSQSDIILDEINNFWSNGEAFHKHGFLHRRGYMLYGPPGGGKTCIVQQIMKNVIQNDGIVFICSTPENAIEALPQFRNIEPDRHVVCVFEDIDSIIGEWGDEELLSLLDGECQIDKVLNLATTNYPEQLDGRIVARPRRFDRVILVKMPNEDIRRLYFEKKLNIEKSELDVWVDKTEDFSFAAMAELVISVKCLGHDLDESIKKLKDLMDIKKSSEDYKKTASFGFGG